MPRSAPAASEAGTNAGANQIAGSCPLCKAAIVIGHNSVAQGAASAGLSAFLFNTDITSHMLIRINALGGGRVTVQFFTRTSKASERAARI